MQGRAETKKGDQVVGSYQYSDGHVKVKVVYSADQHGYRILKEERATMKPFTGSEVTFKAPKEKPFSPKPLKKTPVALQSFQEESGAGDENQNQPSLFAPEAPQGLQLGTFDLKLRTNHGSGGYSHQGLSLNPGRSTKHKVNQDSSSLQDSKPPKTRNPLWQDDDDFNHSLERHNEVPPKPVKIVYKRPKMPFKSAPGNKPKSRKPKVDTEGLAIFFKDQYPINGVSLFRPQEATNPVAAPKKRNPRRLRQLHL
uniref:DNA-binding protein SATB2 n=1 Tax=Lygus hesperus TaxID=30085 RepID=A0A0A9XLQ9_LYGHE